MIKINYSYNNRINSIYSKLEYYNLTGSIKDRVAHYIINNAKNNDILKPNMPIIEATSGNTGIAISALGAYYNHPVHIFMPDWVSKERIDLMKLYGANIVLFSKEDGGFDRCIEEAKILANKINGFLSNQFSNIDNYNAQYESTGKEILEQLNKIDGFVSGIGTGGTLMGVGNRIKAINKKAVITAIEPSKMPLISGGLKKENHKIEGIGDDFIPDLVNVNNIDRIILIDDEDAINMSRLLSKSLGLGVGISSGANFIGSVILNDEINGNIVTIFPDDNKKYLSTSLIDKINTNKELISNNIKLINYEIID